ncbi:ribosome maturation factor RimM [Clostridium formicaceticum]|uniref:Ribosome maturation factor RimM n=1 Tax=Clostridium formicaceticum TaxID=1497 RepID=A0AAC9RKW1_9CLOT|nr:ribosome maturation factor RimM [Clostridium formicaceticum]AOY77337.1 16S rRNA processing protein RimM [Clostridium formicaceticum]ARE87881.1 Ribosome maturation factor RimM [Clostridium formicaceticum]
MKYLKVGKILNTHGLKGEMKIFSLTDYDERFEELEWVYIEGYEERFYINKVKYRPKDILLSFKDYGDINLVEKFKGRYLLIDESQKRDLPEDTYYIADIIGLAVYTLQDEYLGKVVQVLQAGSNEVYIIKDDKGKEIMIPAVKEFMPEISLEKGKIIVRPIEGMIE